MASLKHAGRQSEKLEAAQRLAVSKITPLHVNLPTRGIRHTFTQALQTEPGKPLTVSLVAENAKLPSWTQRLGFGTLGFVTQWALAAFISKRRTT